MSAGPWRASWGAGTNGREQGKEAVPDVPRGVAREVKETLQSSCITERGLWPHAVVNKMREKNFSSTVFLSGVP